MSDSSIQQLQRRVSEACDSLWDSLVDPREAFLDVDGQWWPQVKMPSQSLTSVASLVRDETQLAEVRRQCRLLAATNEFAINGLENRISYLVGPGHHYLATVRKGRDAPDDLVMRVQEVLDEFTYENRWHSRQQEIVRRMDRDGEAFLRYFPAVDGITRVRFIEPEQITTPVELKRTPGVSFGIQTEVEDVESVLGYYVDGQPIAAAEVQHRKANVDGNVKRGLPLYFAVRSNLRRVEKLLRNMSVVAEIQSAIALIRKHRSATRSGVEHFAADQSTTTPTSTGRGVTQYAPGTILDAPAGLEYDFPAQGIDAASFVTVLQAELRAIAARLVMPEFMFTSDASNANYASTLVAEGPAVKMFQRLQATLMQDDCQVMWRVIEDAIAAGRLPRGIRGLVEIQITPPTLRVRDQLRECQVEKIAFEKGILSAQTWSQRLGLDYEQEQKNMVVAG